MSKSAGRNGRGAPVTRVPQKPLSEAAKIEFTKTLHELRNGTLEEFTFPTTLTNIERQFLHKMSDELGLKHKSHGKGESRCMTVKKYVGEIVAVGAPPQVSWEPCQAVEGLLCDRSFTSVNIRHLQQHPGRAKHQITAGSGGRHSNSNSKSNNPTTSNNSNNGAYAILQDKRKAHRDFNAMQTNRSKLPAFEFREVIPQIVNSRQMLLISGETGNDKTYHVSGSLFLLLIYLILKFCSLFCICSFYFIIYIYLYQVAGNQLKCLSFSLTTSLSDPIVRSPSLNLVASVQCPSQSA